MPVCTQDIDDIWNSLKQEEGVSSSNRISLVVSSCRSSRQKECSAERGHDKGDILPFIKKGDELLDLEAFLNGTTSTAAMSNGPRIDAKPTRTVPDEPTDAVVEESKDHFEPILPEELGDSDDEDEIQEKDSTMESDESCSRLERLKSVIGNTKDLLSRIAALQKLNNTINGLMVHCPTPPKLNQPLPYSQVYIKLKGDLPLVSDLMHQSKFDDNSTQVATENPRIRSLKEESVEINNLTSTKQQLQTILDTCGSTLFRLIGDKSEKCRSLSVECLQFLSLSGIDVTRHIPYLMPAIVARFPSCTYDKDMELFVQNFQMHEFYKRGGATDRQDRDGLISSQRSDSLQVIEANEELRLELCRLIDCLVRGALARDALRVLDAYFPEMILSLLTSMNDPYPEVRVEASLLLIQLLRIPYWEQGAKYFATGVARSALQNCRHRNTKVILAAMDLLEASVCVPDRAKRKGAGSAAIADLVGFREENVLPIAAFYDSKCSVSVNILAELASHKNPRIRLRCCKMLAYFLIYLPDRYDHEQRLLPYVLSFISDNSTNTTIQKEALQCIEECGVQYEREHPEEVIERQQLGVDGEDHAIDYDNGLPPPFERRPRLGSRLFVRSNSSRFFVAILGELSSWREETRKRSVDLLLTLCVYCEEHLTKNIQRTIACIAKVLEVETDLQMVKKINQIIRLIAKYVGPMAYLPLICPRVSGDNSSGTSNAEDGCHSERLRSSHAKILSSLIKEMPIHNLVPHWVSLASTLSSSDCIGTFVGTQVMDESLTGISILLERVSGNKERRSFLAHLKSTRDRVKVTNVLLSCKEALTEMTERLDTFDRIKLAQDCDRELTSLIASMEDRIDSD